MIAELLPDAVISTDVFGDPSHARLFPDEEIYVARATAQRRAEFTSARWCARQALARLGHPPVPIPVGQRGAPQWPTGITGSLTHHAGYRAAAVARTTDVVSVGIDAEQHAPLPGEVETIVVTRGERQHLAELRRARCDAHWDRLLFSAKESTYKAWFPLARRWLGFHDAIVAFDPGSKSFTVNVVVPGPVTRFDGRWEVRDGLALTVVSVAR